MTVAKSETSEKCRQPGRPAARARQNETEAPVMDQRVADRAHLISLKKWVGELHEKHGFTYARIADHTWRGSASFGYWQSIATGEHLKPKPRIRPCYQDYHDIRAVVKTARDYGATDARLFDAAMAIVKARAALDGAVADFLEVARKRTGAR